MKGEEFEGKAAESPKNETLRCLLRYREQRRKQVTPGQAWWP